MHRSQPINGQIIPPQPEPLKPKTDEQCVFDDLGEEYGRIALAICDELGCETKGLEEIAGAITGKDGNTAARAFYRAKVGSAALSRRYARACAGRAHVLAHQTMRVIEEEKDAVKARVKLDAIKWLAGKFNRAEFGDEPPTQGMQVTINNDSGVAALEEIRQRLDRKRRALTISERQKSMLTQTGGRVEYGGLGEEERAKPPHGPATGT